MIKKKKKYLKGWHTANRHEHYFDGFKSICGKATQDDIGTMDSYIDLPTTYYTVCANCQAALRKKEGRSLSKLKAKKDGTQWKRL